MSVKLTLLEMVQEILEDMNGDEVNSITDTEESEQVAGHIKKSYRNIVSNSNWFHTRELVTLTSRSDSDFPTHFLVKDNVKKLEVVKYNLQKSGDPDRNYKEIEFKPFEEFMLHTAKRKSSATNVRTVIDDSGIELLILNDKSPDYYTTIDDVNIIFDSYDSTVDTTLNQSKLQAWGLVIPEFEMRDDFVPNLPPDAFALLLEESTSRCNYKMRQMQDPKSEVNARKQSRFMSRQNWIVDGGIKYPNFGRQSVRTHSNRDVWPRRDS